MQFISKAVLFISIAPHLCSISYQFISAPFLRLSILFHSFAKQNSFFLFHCFSHPLHTSLFLGRSLLLCSIASQLNSVASRLNSVASRFISNPWQVSSTLFRCPSSHLLTITPLRLKPCYCTTSSHVNAPLPEFRHCPNPLRHP